MVGLLTFLTVGTAVAIDLWKLLDIRRGLPIVSEDVEMYAAIASLTLP